MESLPEEAHFSITYMKIFTDFHFPIMCKKAHEFMEDWEYIIYSNLTKNKVYGDFHTVYNNLKSNNVQEWDMQTKYEAIMHIENLMNMVLLQENDDNSPLTSTPRKHRISKGRGSDVEHAPLRKSRMNR